MVIGIKELGRMYKEVVVACQEVTIQEFSLKNRGNSQKTPVRVTTILHAVVHTGRLPNTKQECKTFGSKERSSLFSFPTFLLYDY
jgi:hypothetical protein